MPRANLDKNFDNNCSPADLASQASNVASDWEVSVSKDVTILDQAMKVVADLPLNKKAARVAVTTNVDKLGDVDPALRRRPRGGIRPVCDQLVVLLLEPCEPLRDLEERFDLALDGAAHPHGEVVPVRRDLHPCAIRISKEHFSGNQRAFD